MLAELPLLKGVGVLKSDEVDGDECGVEYGVECGGVYVVTEDDKYGVGYANGTGWWMPLNISKFPFPSQTED